MSCTYEQHCSTIKSIIITINIRRMMFAWRSVDTFSKLFEGVAGEVPAACISMLPLFDLFLDTPCPTKSYHHRNHHDHRSSCSAVVYTQLNFFLLYHTEKFAGERWSLVFPPTSRLHLHLPLFELFVLGHALPTNITASAS